VPFGRSLNGISCASPRFCVAVATLGDVLIGRSS
jgi:hypothetical protein